MLKRVRKKLKHKAQTKSDVNSRSIGAHDERNDAEVASLF